MENTPAPLSDMKNLHTIMDQRTLELRTYNMLTGELVSVGGRRMDQPEFYYTDEVASKICDLHQAGHTLTAITQMADMPSMSTINKWRSLRPEFNEAIIRARRFRATIFLEKAEAAIEEAVDRDSTLVQKFKYDAYIKLAERCSPEEFGPKQAPAASQNAPTTFIIYTGIEREAPPLVPQKPDIEVAYEHYGQDERSPRGGGDGGRDAGAGAGASEVKGRDGAGPNPDGVGSAGVYDGGGEAEAEAST